MSNQSAAVVPVTIKLERRIDHPPQLVFDAYADIERRAQWGPPADEAVAFESHDFRAGGTDRFVRRVPDSSSLAGTTHYEHIVEQERIVFTERLVNPAGGPLAISLVSWTLTPSPLGTLLAITDQTTSMAGSGPIEGTHYAYEVMLDRLAGYLDNETQKAT